MKSDPLGDVKRLRPALDSILDLESTPDPEPVPDLESVPDEVLFDKLAQQLLG